jgi:aminodeoxyfutalosine deaminase
MRRISAQFVLTGEGDILKQAIVTAEQNGLITGVENTGSNLNESASTEFYNGVIVPGFINCHCHLELSHMLSCIETGTGLGGFIRGVNTMRNTDDEEITLAAVKADRQMYDEGIVACGDVSNGSISFGIKKDSAIEYITFIEIFGSDSEKVDRRITEAKTIIDAAVAAGLPYHLVPHSVYSVSRVLFDRLLEMASPAPLISMHFLESPDERLFVNYRSGPMLKSYIALGINASSLDPPASHLDIAIQMAQSASRLMLVHNTCITQQEAETLAAYGNISWCLCPSSNAYITDTLPPATMLSKTGGKMVIGTDSLASNNSLSILKEIRLLQEHNPDITFESLICWATANGAETLGLSTTLGTITPGKKPGLLLIENMDLHNMKLLPQSRVRRLL